MALVQTVPKRKTADKGGQFRRKDPKGKTQDNYKQTYLRS
jgi:hypothetical protein